MIQFLAENTDMPRLKPQLLKRWIRQTATECGFCTGEIAFVFCTDERILEVNQQYLQHDYFTDIITFDYTEDGIISGDIFISLDTVASNAQALEIPFTDELHRILIHGILHLCGQDDKAPGDKAEMTRRENEALAQLQRMQ